MKNPKGKLNKQRNKKDPGKQLNNRPAAHKRRKIEISLLLLRPYAILTGQEER